MIVVTRREACKRTMLEVVAATSSSSLPLERRLTVAPTFAEALRAPGGVTTCVIDLGSLTGSGDEVVGAVQRLVAAKPWLGFVLLAAHSNPELEAHVIHGLRELPRVDLVQPRELRDIERWRHLLHDQFLERHARAIEADLRGACAVDQAPLFDDPHLRDLLRRAMRVRKVEDLSADEGRQRVGVWRRFKRLWGRSPSEMLSLFRVLWAAHLRHQGHGSAEVASLLGFRDAEHCARRLGARLGMRKSHVNALSYREVVASVVACLTQGAPVTALVARAGAAMKRAARATAVVVAALVGGLDDVGDAWGAVNERIRLASEQDDDDRHGDEPEYCFDAAAG